MNARKEDLQTIHPTLDLAAARRRLVNNEKLLHELAQFFVDDVPGYLETLTASVQNKDSVQAAQAAHSVKCLIDNFGAVPTETLATVVESAAREARLNRVALLLPELHRQIELICDDLRQELLEGGPTPDATPHAAVDITSSGRDNSRNRSQKKDRKRTS